MANVFGILTAIVLALSAFIAFKNKSAYEQEIANATTEAANLERSQARLVAGQDRDADLGGQIPVVEESIAGLTAQEAGLEKSKADLTKQRDDKTAIISTNKEKLDEIARKTAEIGEIKELAEKMRNTSAELEELEQSINTAQATLANVTADNTQAEALVNTRKSEFENFSRGESLPTLNTRIRSFYPSWGFVTLAAGNNAGVITNSTLNVVRDGQVIAKLLVTAVEDSTASASIIPDSTSDDVTPRVGDRVVPGTKASSTPAETRD